MIHDFNGTNGKNPASVVLAQGRDGRLYGTTGFGGSYGKGVIFKQRTAGTGLEVVYNFSGPDGSNPPEGLTLATDGNFYATTGGGGAYGFGVLFKFTSSGVLTVLHNFAADADGGFPYGPPIEAMDGNLYGVTFGNNGGAPYATIYKFALAGVFSTIYTFPSTQDAPVGPPLQAMNGNLYVASVRGGAEQDCGAVFELTTAGTLVDTFNFDCSTLETAPVAPLLQLSDGTIYGMTEIGGSHNEGTIYTLGTAGAVTVIYDFGSTPTDGYSPQAGFTLGTDGNLYSATTQGGAFFAGSLIQLTPGGNYSQLYSFPTAKRGEGSESPEAPPTQATTGLFYGVTYTGGSSAEGSVYTLDMGLGPFIAFVRPQGHVGATAQILSQGLTETTSVTFNGVAASSFSVVSDTYMTAVVPSGATTGPVVVTTPGGALTSNVNFRISE
jgi:uncharacterized repeat protein (TIGR03803 family)